MRSLTAWALRFRLVVLGLSAAALLYGYTQLPNIPVQLVPDFTPPYVEVQTEALGLAADEVEQLITVPLEADLLHGVAFLDEIHSESIAGLSSIVLVFEPGTDVFRARQVVAERLTQAHALPNVSRPPEMLQPLASNSRVLMVALRSDDVSLIDMSILAHWTIRPRLMGVQGVANVAIWGQRERQLQVLVDPERLRNERIALQHVIENVGNALWVSPLTYIDASTPGTGGFIDTPNQRLGIQHVLPIRTPEDLAEIPLAPEDTGGRIVRLGDIADIVEDHQPLIGDAVVADGQGLILVIERFPGTDIAAVTREIEGALEAMRPGLVGIEIDSTIYRPASSIEEAMGNLSVALLAGLALLLTAVVVIRLDWRLALVVLVAVPLSLAGAGLVLYVAGTTLNAITIAGLLLATVVFVDDAIAGTDAVLDRVRLRTDADPSRSVRAIVLEGTLSGRGGLGAATLVALLATAPALLISGVAGAFVPQLIVAYGVGVLVSALVALTVTPALTSLLLDGRLPGAPSSPVLAWIQRASGWLLGHVLALRTAVLTTAGVVTVAVLALGGVLAVPHLGDPAVPSLGSRDVLVQWDGAAGTSHAAMSRIASRATAELRTIPGVTNAGAHVGRAISSDQVVSVNDAEIWLSIDSAADRTRVLEDVQAVVNGYPGLQRVVTSYASNRISSVLGQRSDDLVVRVYGHELEVLQAATGDLVAALDGVDGIASLSTAEPTTEPTIEVEVDLGAAQEYGIKAGDVRRATTTLLSGILVGNLYEDQKVFEVVVWGAPEVRESVTALGRLVLAAPGGAPVQLAQVADVRIGPAPSVIRREGVFRFRDIGITVAGRSVEDVARDVQARLDQTELPLEYHAELLGDVAAAGQRQLALLAVILAVIIGTALLIQATLGSWRRAALITLTLPMALVGGVVAAALSGAGVTIPILAGFIPILAFAARGAVSLADRYRRFEQDDGLRLEPAVLERGAGEHATATVTTAIAAAVALLPLAVMQGASGLEVVGPASMVVIGGLVTTTLYILFVVPSLVSISGPGPEVDPVARLAGHSEAGEIHG